VLEGNISPTQLIRATEDTVLWYHSHWCTANVVCLRGTLYGTRRMRYVMLTSYLKTPVLRETVSISPCCWMA